MTTVEDNWAKSYFIFIIIVFFFIPLLVLILLYIAIARNLVPRQTEGDEQVTKHRITLGSYLIDVELRGFHFVRALQL